MKYCNCKNEMLLYVSEIKTSKKKFLSVCLYVWVCVLSEGTITFQVVSAFNQNLVITKIIKKIGYKKK